MIDKKPKTYNEIIRMKKCYTLTKYFSNITENTFNEIYNFLGESPDNTIIANQNTLSFVNGTTVIKAISLVPLNSSFDNITISHNGISIVPHYSPSSGSSFSGSSSNNNNNNNNNNNR